MKNNSKTFIFFCIYTAFTSLHLISSAPFTHTNSNWNVNFNPDPSDPSKYYGKWENHTYFPSPENWKDESIYQFITDRFADGDPTNNEGKYGGFNLNDVHFRHGGDFKGIINKLDYIKGLGYTCIWISPFFQNQYNSYHGYAQVDFTVIDDRFGTLDELRTLVTEAHRRNIKVIVDYVVNHMSDLLYFEGHEHSSAPFRFHKGEYRLFWRDETNKYEDFHIDNTFYPYGKYCDVYDSKGNRVVDNGSGSFWNSDFHHNGNLYNYDDPWENALGKIYGLMDDLRTSHPRIQNKFIAMTSAMIESIDIDGIRVDTPMEVPLEFFQKWIGEVKSFAGILGKKNFYIFGEYYCNKELASTMTGRGKSPHMYGKEMYIGDKYMFDGGINYSFYKWFISSVKEHNHNVKGIHTLFKQELNDYDWYNPYTNKKEYRHLNFINNHDQFRLSSSEDGFEKTRLGSGLIAFWPGVPLFYYGDEQGFMTDGNAFDGDSREDFMTSLAWKDKTSKYGMNMANKDNFNMISEYFQYVQRVMNVRNTYKVLRTCDNIVERWVQVNNTNGVFAYERRCDDEKALIIFNTWKQNLPVSNLNTYWTETRKIYDVLSQNISISLRNGFIDHYNIEAYKMYVFIPEEQVKKLKLTVVKCNYNHDDYVRKTDDNEFFFIIVYFSSIINKKTIEGNVYFNNNQLSVDSITYMNDHIILNNLSFKEGVNKLTVKEKVMSEDDINLISDFHMRIRYGNDDNIIMNNHHQKRNNIVLYSPLSSSFSSLFLIKINHFAIGAEKFRVLFKFNTEALKKSHEKWSSWVEYNNEKETIIHLDKYSLFDICEVVVQYFVDNSSAYYIYQSLNFS